VSAPDVEALQHGSGGAKVARDEESRRLREPSKWRSRLVLIELIFLLLIVLLVDILLFVLVRAL
jgi:hypothetical protein